MRQLTAGTGRLMITPPFDCELSGFVAREGRSRGVHDPLYARALVLADGKEKIALVSVDALGVDAKLLAKVREKVAHLTDLNPSSVMISATHTHSGPVTMEDIFLGEVDPAYRNGLINNIAGAVYLANQTLEPVTVFVGEEECRSVGKNRRQKGGPTDAQVLVVRLQGADGPKALLVNYACHPVVLGPDNFLVTADYPYYLLNALEQVYPGAQAMFMNGATGDVNVGHNTADSIQGKGNDRRTFREAARLGRILAGVALTASENAVALSSVNLSYAAQELSVPFEQAPTADFYLREVDTWKRQAVELKQKGASFGEYHQAEVWAQWAGKMAELQQANKIEPVIKSEVAAFSLGELEFVTLPGEFFHEFALMIKKERAPRRVVILGYTNHNIGYVAPEHVYDEGGYEVNDSYRYYGLPSPLTRGAGEEIVRTLLTMLKKLKNL